MDGRGCCIDNVFVERQGSRSRSITRWVLIGLPKGRMASKGLSIRQSVTLSRRLVVVAKSEAGVSNALLRCNSSSVAW